MSSLDCGLGSGFRSCWTRPSCHPRRQLRRSPANTSEVQSTWSGMHGAVRGIDQAMSRARGAHFKRPKRYRFRRVWGEIDKSARLSGRRERRYLEGRRCPTLSRALKSIRYSRSQWTMGTDTGRVVDVLTCATWSCNSSLATRNSPLPTRLSGDITYFRPQP